MLSKVKPIRLLFPLNVKRYPAYIGEVPNHVSVGLLVDKTLRVGGITPTDDAELLVFMVCVLPLKVILKVLTGVVPVPEVPPPLPDPVDVDFFVHDANDSRHTAMNNSFLIVMLF